MKNSIEVGNRADNAPDKKGKQDKPNMFGITFDERKQKYIVRLMAIKGKLEKYKEFSVNRYGDKTEALIEAMKYRNEECSNLLISCHRERESVELSNNITGVSGVHRRNDREQYTATWYDNNGVLQRAQFSEKKWGPKQAFFMAWATKLLKRKIFIKDKETKEYEVDPEKCFQIVDKEYPGDDSRQIWIDEERRVGLLNQEK